MDWPSLIGRIGGGFAVKVAVAVVAFIVASEVYSFVSSLSGSVTNALQ